LAGFSRVHLKAGESRSVTLHVAPRQLQYWSVADAGWKLAPGGRTIYVGASSRDLKLNGRAPQ
jgi:beta-glucosidase